MKYLAFFISLVAFSITARAQTRGKTTIEFESKIIDYGTIKKGSNGNKTFLFTNTGTIDFEILNVFSSSTYDIISKPEIPIKPGEKGKIVVNYDTKKLGPIVKTITVKGNMEGGIVALKLKGTVVE
jgi:hypothetical protein